MTTSIFSQKKSKILSQLAVPDTEYADASPKGSVDAGIRDLIDEINALEGVVTTSSCAGRVSVYLEGHKKGTGKEGKEKSAGRGEENENQNEEAGESVGGERNSSTAGGKGGGEWLFVSHDPLPGLLTLGEGVAATSWSGVFGLEDGDSRGERAVGEGAGRDGEGGSSQARLIHFKFEPMVSTLPETSYSYGYTSLLLTLPLDSPRPDSIASACPTCCSSRHGGRVP